MNAKVSAALFADPRFSLPADLHILTEREAAAFLRVSTRCLQAWRRAGTGPPWVRVGPGAGRIGYVRSDLLGHITMRKFSSAAAEEAFRALEGV